MPENMKEEYDLENMKRVPRDKRIAPDPEALKTTITIRLDVPMLLPLKDKAEKLGMPYQTLINSVLTQYIKGDLVDKAIVKELKELILGLKKEVPKKSKKKVA